ncbi:MAG TPA: hypothetical protein PKW82_11485 [Spirochaetales bacterium]|nr:hypothetical protein [Spirochaetales bacterium]
METSVGSILDAISTLSLEDQELVDEIMRKRIIEAKRDEIRADYLASLEERAQGRAGSGMLDALFDSL